MLYPELYDGSAMEPPFVAVLIVWFKLPLKYVLQVFPVYVNVKLNTIFKQFYKLYKRLKNFTILLKLLALFQVLFLLYLTNLLDSIAILSKMSLMKEFIILIAFLLIPVSGCTYFNTL